jgi:subtilisin family serine protease
LLKAKHSLPHEQLPTRQPMNSHILPSTLRRCSFAVPTLAIFLFSSAASALLMRDNGPEPIIVQIRESLRLSDDLDNHLSQLETTRNRDALDVVKWCVGNKLLVMLSFPSNYTERQALAVIGRLQSLPAVEKVVAVSASNLEFAPADFTREYTSNQAIPEAARRGLDRDELSRSPLTPAQIDEAAQMPHVPNQLIVRWKPRYAWRATAEGFLQDIANFHAAGRARVIKETRRSPTDLKQVIEIDDRVTPFADKLRRYVECPWVDYVQPNFIYTHSAVVNDPYYTNPGQPNLGQVKAPQAWSSLGGNTTGNQNLVVAVGDSGLNLAHPDFSPNVLPSGHHNFVNNSSDVSDFELYNYVCGCYESSHGNNVTGILGAKGNNLNVPPGNPGYMVGVTHHVSLLILKVTGGGSGNSEDVAAAIVYAATADQTRPAAIAINLSLGNQPSSQLDKTLEAAVDTARGLGMVVVAAAGNHGVKSDDDDKLVSPASIPTDNLIAVGAVRSTGDPDGPDTKPNFSNYGRYRVELGAPGGADGDTIFNPSPYGILGLRQNLNHNPPWSRKSGTSMAAPHVTGAIQLVKSKYSWENYAGLRDRVIMATDDVAALDPNGLTPFRTGGRLNLEKALKKRTVIRNASVRAKVENNDRIVIGGIIVGPSGPCGGANQPPCLTVAIRGLGPTLPPLGVPRLNNPKLRLNNYAGFQLTSNDDWGNLTQDQRNQLAAAGLTPGDPREAAIVYTMPPGTYTVFMESQDGQQGVGLFEIYELAGGNNEQVRLKNLSVRCPVGVGDEVAIAGTNLTNSLGSAAPKRRLLMQAKGPSLSAFGLQGVLADPQIELRNSLGVLLDSNDQWKDVDGVSKGLEDKLVKAGFRPLPSDPEQYLNESALWPTLVQGTYTAIMKGVNNGTGIGLIDFLEY